MKRKIFVEGKTDVIFVKALGIPARRISKTDSKGKVCKKVSKSIYVIGLVDQDPTTNPPEYIRKKTQFLNKKHNITLHWDKEQDNYIISLCPALEGWLMTVVKGTAIDLSQYFKDKKRKIKITAHNIHKVILSNLDNLVKLVQYLIDQKNPAILYLQHLLNTL